MKQIFDWLREQIEAIALRAGWTNDVFVNVHDVGIIIDEAEAKWESECCVWKKSEVYGYIKNPHTGRIFSNEPSMQNVYCNTCGKPIKISEVE